MNLWHGKLVGLIGVLVLSSVVLTCAQDPNVTTTPKSPYPLMHDPNLLTADSPLNGSMVARVLGALLIVIVLAVAVMWLSKRLLGQVAHSKGGRIRVRETCPLGPRKALHWIEAGNQRFLIGSTAERIVLLSELLDDEKWETSLHQEEQ